MYIKTAGYNGACTVVSFLDILVLTHRQTQDFIVLIPNDCGMKSLLFRSMRVTAL